MKQHSHLNKALIFLIEKKEKPKLLLPTLWAVTVEIVALISFAIHYIANTIHFDNITESSVWITLMLSFAIGSFDTSIGFKMKTCLFYFVSPFTHSYRVLHLVHWLYDLQTDEENSNIAELTQN